MCAALFGALVVASPASAAGDAVCLLYADDTTRSFYFGGVSPSGKLVPLLTLQAWDSVLVGLDAGEDNSTLYIVPEGVGPSPNMTIATLHTSTNGSASVSYAVLGAVPSFPAPYTYMNTLHLDAERGQMIATLVGMAGPPPASPSSSYSPLAAAGVRPGVASRRRRSRGGSHALTRVGDPGDLFFVVADVFPRNGTVSRVWLDLSEYDMKWGDGAISGVSAFDGSSYWVNPVGGQVPSGQALYGFPLNGSAPTVVPYGRDLSLGHLFYSTAQRALLGVMEDATTGVPSLVRFTPPSANFTTLFTWPGTDQDWGTYDVSKDGSQLLSVLVDKKGVNPALSIVSLVGQIKEVNRIPLQGFSESDTVCDVNFCSV